MRRFRACCAEPADARAGIAQRCDLLVVLPTPLAGRPGRDHRRIAIRRTDIVHDTAWPEDACARGDFLLDARKPLGAIALPL